MMHLSRLILNPRSRAVQRDLADLYDLHCTVMRGFPDNLPDSERVLYRLDEDQRTARLSLLVQSQMQPDWSALPSGYLLPPDPFGPVGENPAVKPFAPQVKQGQFLHFRLRANPTKRLGKSSGKDAGKRVGLYRPEEQFSWLARKAETGGFALLSAQPSADTVEKGRKQPIRLLAVLFDGTLQVVDPERFQTTLAQGVGSGKAFGCGLLSIAPAR